MRTPPYFEQQHTSACSLAVLRSILAQQGINITEAVLLAKVEADYGKQFKIYGIRPLPSWPVNMA